MAFKDGFEKGQIIKNLRCPNCNFPDMTWFDVLKNYFYLCFHCYCTFTEEDIQKADTSAFPYPSANSGGRDKRPRLQK
ncbi:hypothetical protein COV49_01765 [Candidatus Falkowbacteria bacterium CG11_big_fil_rev_8_21_14_0_20_39_10]|uniref:Uncharacterized protein n=1 Tax=Candidatus Falkowbacteria bacterium CG11_big_fil_rev_8_21_14_0_20_39_10 TaxID=1974570 RepID=A0A2M6K9A1_9BACT|nr:MAG: hypothetical protein COV49_01765 [Candidatus Falkowbacteria bacterium CG11_big_fil_rev_8_21_14_0_20_39_10]